jgi:hypothetical protein
MQRSSLNFPDGFKEAIKDHLERMEQAREQESHQTAHDSEEVNALA